MWRSGRTAWRAGLILSGSLLMAGTVAGCGDHPVPPTELPSASTVTAVTRVTETTATLPAGEPVEIYRLGEEKELWKAWIEGDSVVLMESAGPAAHTGIGMAYSASGDWDTVFRIVPLSGGEPEDIPGVRLAAPEVPDTMDGITLTLPLAWAELLPGSASAPAKLVWAAPPQVLSGTYLFRGLFFWSPEGTPLEVLPGSTVSLRAKASGDAIAIPIPKTTYSESRDPNDPAIWDKLLMVTANMSAPIEVDPAAPRLPEEALAGLSPYFSFATDAGSSGLSVYDLRTGQKLTLQSPVPQPWSLQVAGHHAAWRTESGDLYVADLDAGTTDKVLLFEKDEYTMPAFALGEEWLVALQPRGPWNFESALDDPSQHPGADLIALHLPDLRRVDIPGVIPKGQLGSMQISGDTVLLTVTPALMPMPHEEPEWTALQVLRLE